MYILRFPWFLPLLVVFCNTSVVSGDNYGRTIQYFVVSVWSNSSSAPAVFINISVTRSLWLLQLIMLRLTLVSRWSSILVCSDQCDYSTFSLVRRWWRKTDHSPRYHWVSTARMQRWHGQARRDSTSVWHKTTPLESWIRKGRRRIDPQHPNQRSTHQCLPK